jgi:hypothetical protein
VNCKIAYFDVHGTQLSPWLGASRAGLLAPMTCELFSPKEQVHVHKVVCDDGSYHIFPNTHVVGPDSSLRFMGRVDRTGPDRSTTEGDTQPSPPAIKSPPAS